MKTTQKKAVNAYNALTEIGRQPFPIRDALNLLVMRKKLETVMEFQLQEEQKLIDEYQPTIEGGKISMPYDEKDEAVKARAQEFFRKLADLNKLEVEVDADPAPVCIPDSVSIKPETLAALDGFIDWRD